MPALTLASNGPVACDAASPAETALVAQAPRGERLEALRSALRKRFPAALSAATPEPLPAQPPLPRDAPPRDRPTDPAVLGHLLPEGGLPRGKITEWACARSGGSATLLRALVRGALARGEAVALVDAGRSLAAADWVEAARAGELTVVRPRTPEEGPFCAELLLGARAFALVVLDGVGLPPRVAPRLAHRVREAGCALLVVLPDVAVPWQGSNAAALRIALAPQPATAPRSTAHPRSARSPKAETSPMFVFPRIVASLVKGGAPDRTELCCVVPTPDRLCAHPLVPDRRGGARHGRSW